MLYQFVRELLAVSKFNGIVVTVNEEWAKYPLADIAPGLEDMGLQRQAGRTVQIGQYQIDVYK
jgi:hypothetical protein